MNLTFILNKYLCDLERYREEVIAKDSRNLYKGNKSMLKYVDISCFFDIFSYLC